MGGNNHVQALDSGVTSQVLVLFHDSAAPVRGRAVAITKVVLSGTKT